MRRGLAYVCCFELPAPPPRAKPSLPDALRSSTRYSPANTSDPSERRKAPWLMLGLLNAAQNFTPTKGANFETYAGIRIRGAMLDEARRSNWTPRSTFRNAKQVSLAIRSIENRTGRDAKAQDIAGALGVSLEQYHRMVESAASSRILSYEQLAGDPERASMLPHAPEGGPEATLEGDQFREAIGAAIAALPERERLVLSLYYDQELNLGEIGEILEVSESRVCQIHGQAVLRVRARLDKWFNDE